ncbi:MAG: glycine zipper domain-containing protein [Beijerinckiaceae bacterium]|nr:glycine zipper domain-containing protein [Beijerinckiaceae bacterium]
MILTPRPGKLLLAGLFATSLAGCMNEYGRNDSALYGGVLGAGAGAVVGGAVTGRTEGALAGAVIGGAGGAVIGDAAGRDRRYNRRYRQRGCEAYDSYGNRYRVSC